MSYTNAQMRQTTTARGVMLSVHDADDWEWICEIPRILSRHDAGDAGWSPRHDGGDAGDAAAQ